MRPLNIYLVTCSKAAGVVGSTIYSDNILQSLEKAGYNVIVYNYEKEIAQAEIKDTAHAIKFCTEGILHRFEQHQRQRPFDLVFCLVNNLVVDPPALRQMSEKVFTVNYTTNYHQFHLIEEVAKYVTLSTYISLPAKDAFDRIGARSYWMPMAANPEIYRPCADRDRYAAFVGTAYGERPYYMWRLLQHGIDIQVYGPFWTPKSARQRFLRNWGEPLLYVLGNTERRLKFISRNERRLIIEHINEAYPARVHGPLPDAIMLQTLATSCAIINIAESRFNHDYLNHHVLRGCNFRDFEVPMAGACLVTQYSAELEHFYESGREVVVFHDDVELADKLKYYAKNLSELQGIANAGHRRAREEHTWLKRFEALFKHIGLT